MLPRALLRNAVALRSTSRLAIARFSSPATTTGASSSVFSAVGRDVPLNVVSRQARRQARKLEKSAGGLGSAPATKGVRTSSLPSKISFALLAGSVSGSVLWHFILDEATKKSITDILGATFLGDIYALAATKVEDLFRPFTDPSREKLLPDWPIPQVPADTPPVPVLVLDLEDTLVHSEWSRKHGWRHAKRPGVDEFLETLCQYYEIVIFSQNPMAEEVVMKLDPKQCALHILSRDATRYLKGAHVKDLANLNRDLRQVVIVDDDPAAYQLQPENAIPIKPFTNGSARDDRELTELIPFLKALASERVPDFRTVLGEFRDEDGVIRDLPSRYSARVRALEMQKEQEKQKGLGGFIRGRLSHRPPTAGGVGM
uniref:Mitochondrial import inner membrane translocase subunit TIM50 n=1 Tax=Globisporangium ultimum (strain ATCC 200006 / CBS 805.95 / DAOM BR144) TaxID=431595 RepID=K3WIV8_GLOUD